MKEFRDNYTNCHPGDSGFNGSDPQEPVWDWASDPSNVHKFITQTLAAHKELILKMVREKVPSHSMTRDYESTLRNRWREEFLNNLDTL